MSGSRRPHDGFSLLEILIALLILSFGILAAMGLQVVVAINVQNATQRAMAAQLAHDLLGRIRSNSSPGANAAYLSAAQNVEMGNAWFGDAPAADCARAGASCSPAAMALFDLWQWEQTLDGRNQLTTVNGQTVSTGGLVDPTACLSGPGAGGEGEYQVVIVWRSALEAENPDLEDRLANDCGNTPGRYGIDNANRRVLSMRSYMAW